MTKPAKNRIFFAALVLSLHLANAVHAAPAASTNPRATGAPTSDPLLTRAPWPAQRPLLLLPLQLGPGWNLDREKAALILPIAEQKLQQAMQRTGKLSTMQIHRYNPILRRAVQEKFLTRQQSVALAANPTLEGVQRAFANMRFDQAPLIAEFAMEEVRTEIGSPSPVVTAQVTGKLYEVNNPIAVKTVVVTSDPVPLYVPRIIKNKNYMVARSTSDRLLAAADNSFIQIAREFTKPIEDIELPEPTQPETIEVIPDPNPVRPPRPDTTPPVIEVPAGQVLGSFPVPAPRRRR